VGSGVNHRHILGVAGRVRYDNLTPAVVGVLAGRTRVEHERFIRLRSHYGFDSFFCQPGLQGAHEKGGVEGEIGRFRRRHLVPIPVVGSLAELDRHLAEADLADDRRHIAGRQASVGDDFALEQPALGPLPATPFEAARTLPPHRVDHKARVSVRQCFYSVPARFAGQQVNVRLGASQVEFRSGGQVIACHERLMGRFGESLQLDHYLEVLVRKPGALPGATPLAQARAQGGFTAAHEAFWVAARRKLGDQAGTRALIEILLAHRHLRADALVQAMDALVAAGIVDPAVVLVQARRLADGRPDASPVPIGTLHRYDRPAPTLHSYDHLLELQGVGA
jgi:hypothetical protein